MRTTQAQTPEIIKDDDRCREFFDIIIATTNANTKALGFLPAGVYSDALAAGRLWVLVINDQYCGHILFGGAHPTLHVKQLYVVESMRGRGLARLLVDELVAHGESQGYTSIRARVAADLEANAAWERLGFEVVSIVAGGQSTGRTINKRFRRLTPRGLQTHMFAIFEGPSVEATLLARGMPLNRDHWYTLDLNVWLDFAMQRQPFYDSARFLIESASRGQFRLRFTQEAKAEARRTSAGRQSDPLMAVVETWQAVPEEDNEGVESLVERLRPLIFPERALTGRRAANDTSDLRHIAFSIRAGATGFVTREKAILRQRGPILRHFGLEVLSPSDLVEYNDPLVPPLTSLREGLKLEPIAQRRRDAVAFVKEITGRRARLRALDYEDDGWVCLLGDRIVGIVYWGRTHRHDVETHLAMDNSDRLEADARQRVLDVLLGILVAEARSSLLFHRLLLRADVDTCEQYRQDFQRMGFFEAKESDLFVKFVSGDPLEFREWAQARPLVEQELGAESEWLGDRESGPVLRVCRDQAVVNFDRFRFETFFGITALTLTDRRGFYIPIQEKFANELLPRPWRPPLFREHDASFRLERVYFRDPRFTGDLRPGDLVLFYVSKPICALVGAARCTASEVLGHEEAAERFRRLAVLDPREKGPKVHCIAFDNYVPFRQRLGLDWITRSHAKPSNNFVTIAPIPPTVERLEFFREGLRVER